MMATRSPGFDAVGDQAPREGDACGAGLAHGGAFVVEHEVVARGEGMAPRSNK